ncbi:MAG: hypothetical protein CVV10_01665 [Gammaproteobacteria bacterium HGW-Gammaproteobacteria-14]|nr:MAG: hypothetical protein CVV10_01665 [Gammaproteobacteria bacterium HGW-Gammaproteobacteria-14]
MKRRQFLQHSALALAISPYISLTGCSRSLRADYVIVGSGPAGIAIADRLALAGKQVLVLEGGGRESTPALQTMHAVEPGQWGLQYDYSRATLRQLGGTSALWQSHSPRPHDIELLSASQRGVGEDWPISPEQLRPWLAQAEAWLRIRPAHPADNPTLPRNPFIDSSTALRSLLDEQGYKHHQAAAYGMVNKDDIDALRLLSHGEIDRVAALRTISVQPYTVVRRVLMDGRRARALECADQHGNALLVEGETIILCGGGIQTPRLLWNSGENGIGNHSDWLGAGFMDHPGIHLYGHREKPLLPEGIEHSRVHVFDMLYDPRHRGVVGTLLNIGLRPAKDGGEFTVVEALFEQAPDHGNRVVRGTARDALGDPLAKLDLRLGDADKAGITLGHQLQRQLAEQVGPVTRPSPFRVSSHHLTGATRMASDPAHGVVDADLRVWGTDNLYIASSSVFPTGLTVPPTLILTALAQRLAAHLAT